MKSNNNIARVVVYERIKGVILDSPFPEAKDFTKNYLTQNHKVNSTWFNMSFNTLKKKIRKKLGYEVIDGNNPMNKIGMLFKPSVLMYGEKDEYISSAWFLQLFNKINSNLKKMRIVLQGSHYSERQPEDLNFGFKFITRVEKGFFRNEICSVNDFSKYLIKSDEEDMKSDDIKKQELLNDPVQFSDEEKQDTPKKFKKKNSRKNKLSTKNSLIKHIGKMSILEENNEGESQIKESTIDLTKDIEESNTTEMNPDNKDGDQIKLSLELDNEHIQNQIPDEVVPVNQKNDFDLLNIPLKKTKESEDNQVLEDDRYVQEFTFYESLVDSLLTETIN